MESIEDMYMTASNKNEINLQIMTTPSSYYLKLADTSSVVTLYLTRMKQSSNEANSLGAYLR